MRRFSGRWLVPWSAALLLLVPTTAVGPASASAVTTPQRAAYDTAPTSEWMVTSGTVRAMTVTNDALIIGGDFTAVRNTETGQTVERRRIAAFDKVSGDLLPTFASGANNAVWALASSGSTVWVGGDFTSIAGSARSRIAALNATTGAIVSGFQARASGRVMALEHSDGTVFAGGGFGEVNGRSVSRLAALNGSTGGLVDGWSGSANAQVRSLALVPGTGTLAVGGRFATLSGQARRFLGSVRVTDGSATGFRPEPACSDCHVLDVAASPTTVFAAIGGPGGRAMAWSVGSSARLWGQRADGDVQVVELVSDTLYVGGHFSPHFGSASGNAQTRYMLAAVASGTGSLHDWVPRVEGGLGVWALRGDGRGLWVGGSFRRVNGDTDHARLALLPAL